MYEVRLTESYFPAQHDLPVLQTTVGGILRDQAARSPNAEALVEADMAGVLRRRWTYAELLADAERLAHALASRYRPGERVAIWAPNIPEWVIFEYAAGLAGLVLVTANPGYQPRELKYVIEQSGARGLFHTAEFRGNPMARIAAEVAGQVPALREVIDLEDQAALYAGAEARTPLPDVKPQDAAQIQYTSGTTGFPKGALLHHLGLTNSARLTLSRLDAAPGRAMLNPMPMFHTSGCGICTLGTMQYGARMILAKMFDPARMLDIIEAEKVEFMLGVPTMLTAMLEVQAASPRDLSSVLTSGSGGAMVAPELVKRIRDQIGCGFVNMYGQTEISPLISQNWPDDSFEDSSETVGQPVAQTEVAIRDVATDAVVPVGQVGEICARSFGVMLGYNDNPDATAAAIDKDGWLRTGDLGTMDARGYVRITGRVKEMIIRGGENLFPAEIENVLLEHPAVAEAAVVGAPDERWGEIAICFLRAAPGAKLDRADLVTHLRERIAAQKTPAHWIEVAEWPMTGSGKIQKFVLRDRFVAGEFETL
jgi:fatty-acyl-CoA synthase